MIALIDYDMGNLLSVAKALQSVGGEVRLIHSGDELKGFDRCVLPGVGNFGDGMKNLKSRGLVEPVLEFAASGRPLLGICMGMQMLLDSSEEAPGVPGLGLIRGRVLRFPAGVGKVPHMGWNNVSGLFDTPYLAGVEEGSFFYFVHSYYAEVDDQDCSWGECEYSLPFSAIAGRGRIMGVQFHPEKSQRDGLRILRNFVETPA